MKKTLLKLHRYNFLIIFGPALLVLITVLKTTTLPGVQFLLILSLIFFYLSWALVYHFIDKSLNLEVILEYILTALLSIVVLYGVLL